MRHSGYIIYSFIYFYLYRRDAHIYFISFLYNFIQRLFASGTLDVSAHFSYFFPSSLFSYISLFYASHSSVPCSGKTLQLRKSFLYSPYIFLYLILVMHLRLQDIYLSSFYGRQQFQSSQQSPPSSCLFLA